jgi:hypothetical protein
MRLINDIFWPHLGKFVIIYLDDILVFTGRGMNIFNMFAQYWNYCDNISFQVKEKKSYFAQTFVQYLGFIVDQIGVRPDPSRV